MQIEKYTSRVNYLIELISKECTGSPAMLARKLGISRRMLFNYLEVLKDKEKKFTYCRKSKTYKFLD